MQPDMKGIFAPDSTLKAATSTAIFPAAAVAMNEAK
jgi:hypothetical protein